MIATASVDVQAATFQDLINLAPGEHPDRITRGRQCAPTITQWWAADGIIQFSTTCSQKDSTGPWTQLIQLQDWESILESSEETMDLVTGGGRPTWPQVRPLVQSLLRNSNVLVYCDCPDFLYSGANYNVSRERAVYPGFEEGRAPRRHLEWGLGRARICKHLYAVYNAYLR